ncbi:hypothetical protein [Nocardia seriolae]|uniref:hypothetical protein n=1 Tax=Nocardia seriolae TaxID=37332 RepID=UPI0004AFC7FF|nr:hypothetical protein [Nocardia seriolae]PSK28318.1 hypothetical protein C6575_27110 [Nocardia seriolae]
MLFAVAALGANMAVRMGFSILAIPAFAIPTVTGVVLAHRRLARLSVAEPPAPRWYEPFLLGCVVVASALTAIIAIIVG